MSEVGATLLAKAIAGDVVALERLLMRYQSRLLARLRKKVPPSMARVIAAEDVLQECLFSVFRAIRNFRPAGPFAFERWLITIADNCLLDAIRNVTAAKRGGGWNLAASDLDRSNAISLLDFVAVDSHTPSRSSANRELVRSVLAAIERIKPDYREVVRLRFLEELDTAEVAARLGKSEWSVHKLCARGLRELERELAQNESSQW